MTKLIHLENLSSPILITGHTGFKGTWLMLLLDQLNIPYVGISLPPGKDSLYSRTTHKNLLNEHFQDIRDSREVEKLILQYQPKVIIHLAAQPLVIDSYRDPLGTFSTNVMGTANILEASRKTKTNSFVGVITTDKVYRNTNTRKKFVEGDPIMGADPYSASKASTENVIAAWRSIPDPDTQLYISALRAGNVIGGGDLSANRLLPDLVRSFISGDTPKIRNPKSIRPWQHALDPILGYLLAINHSIETHTGNDFNFGPTDDGLTVEEVAKIACDTWGLGLHPLITENKNSPHEAQFLDLSSEKAKNILGWQPNWSQRDSVKLTINWWKNLDNRSATECCLEDIHSILGRMN